jgi:hypothetical protein
MYTITHIAYGIPWTEELEEAYAKHEGCTREEVDPWNLEDDGFEFFYDGAGRPVSPGLFGEVLWSDASWELTPEIVEASKPSEETKAKVDSAYDNLPDWIKQNSDRPKFFFFESDS